MSAYTNEELRVRLVRAERLLRKIYHEDGPRGFDNRLDRPLPTDKFAAMSRKKVDENWDFPRRHLMHKIAKALES